MTSALTGSFKGLVHFVSLKVTACRRGHSSPSSQSCMEAWRNNPGLGRVSKDMHCQEGSRTP